MLGKIGLPLLALGAMLGIGAAKPANAQVQFGVQVGPTYPYCSVYDPYCTPYAYDPYVYAAPAPYVYGGWGWGHGDHDWDRGYRGGYAVRGGHEFHGGGGGFRGAGGGHGGRGGRR
jgi:hypothetical protein